MATITVEEHNLAELVDFLNDVRAVEFLDKAVWESIGEQLKIQTQKRFQQEVDPDGNKWQPLSEKYAKRKAKKVGTDKGILQFSGNLHNLLRYQADDYGVKFGSDRKYARAQQFGNPKQNLPARPFLGLSDEDKKAIAEEITEAWQQWLAENG